MTFGLPEESFPFIRFKIRHSPVRVYHKEDGPYKRRDGGKDGT